MATYVSSQLYMQPSAAAVVPTVTVVEPVANPCDPRAVVTVNYSAADGTAGCLLAVYAYGDESDEGLYGGLLVYHGDPSTPGSGDAAPTDAFEVTANSDNGTSGSLSLRPITGLRWPRSTITWRATIISSAGVVATDSAQQNVTVPVSFDVVDPIRIRQNTAEVREGDGGSVFSYLLRTFDRDVPTITGKTLLVRYSVNGAAAVETEGDIPVGYSPTGIVYFQLPEAAFANPGNVRVELALVDDATGDSVTYPVDDTINIFVSSILS